MGTDYAHKVRVERMSYCILDKNCQIVCVLSSHNPLVMGSCVSLKSQAERRENMHWENGGGHSGKREQIQTGWILLGLKKYTVARLSLDPLGQDCHHWTTHNTFQDP